MTTGASGMSGGRSGVLSSPVMRVGAAYLHRRQRQPRVVANYFNEKHVRYAAAA